MFRTNICDLRTLQKMEKFIKILIVAGCSMIGIGVVLAQDLTIHPDENKKMSFKPPVLSEEEMRSW